MVDKNSSFTLISAGAAVVLSFISQNAAAFGVLIALISLLVNIWFKWQHLQVVKKKEKSDGDTD